MVTITLDEVIRKTLNKASLPLHYYIKYLLFAREGLKEMQFSILPSEKTTELALDADHNATLPIDFVGEVGVYKSSGDKLIQLPHNHLISSFNNTTPFPEEDAVTLTSGVGVSYIDEFSSDSGRQFGEVYPRVDGYRIIPELNKIRVDNITELDKIYLKYVTMPQKTTNKSLIHPYIEPALVAYIVWQVASYANDRNMLVKRAEYYNQRRLAKANLNKINITDILSSFRIYHNQAIKT
jgi:hypothetical protein